MTDPWGSAGLHSSCMAMHAKTSEADSAGHCCTIEFGGASLMLTGDRAVWWADERALLIADVHLGKPASFRERGAPVPEEVTAGDLARLDALIERFAPGRLIVLGDLAHDRAAWRRTTLEAFAAWRATHAGVGVVLVRGNHDRWAADPPASLDIEVVEPGWVLGSCDARIAMHHEPPSEPSEHTQSATGLPALCGHLHPGVRLHHARGRGRPGMRSACFWFSGMRPGPPVGVLPAFGRFTGCAMVTPGPGDRVFAVGEGRVIEIGTPTQPRAG